MSESNPTEPQDLNKLISRRNLLENAELRIKELEQEIADLVEDNQVLLTDMQKEIERGFKDEERIDELTAHCNDMNDLLNAIAAGTNDAWIYNDINRFNQTPKQSLANIKSRCD